MLEITLAGENKQFLPLVDIEAITIEKNKENYFLKLHHSGGWEYSGLYKMMGKENTETVKAKLQGFLYNFEPFDEDLSAELCHSVRYLKTSTDDDNFYDFEYKMLRLAGITDIHNADDLELKLKMSELWNKHYKDFECMSATNIYPIGNYLRQLARADGEDAFELVLDNYGFDPNIIDRDGCSALNYLVAQISSPESYAIPAIERFKKYHKILLEYGAKTANELCGCEKC